MALVRHLDGLDDPAVGQDLDFHPVGVGQGVAVDVLAADRAEGLLGDRGCSRPSRDRDRADHKTDRRGRCRNYENEDGTANARATKPEPAGHRDLLPSRFLKRAPVKSYDTTYPPGQNQCCPVAALSKPVLLSSTATSRLAQRARL